MKLHLFLSLIIIALSLFLGVQLISNSISNQKDKNDYAELNHIKYGIFSVDAWKQQLTIIITEEINKLYLSKIDERDLKKHIETLLSTLIDKVAKQIKEGNANSAKGWFKQSLIDIFIDLKDVKKGIPEYADAVIKEMTKTQTQSQVKSILNKHFEKYFEQTFEKQDNSQLNLILLKTNSPNIESAKSMLNNRINITQNLISKEAIALIVLSIILFGLSGFTQKPLSPVHYIILILSLIALLITGITTPMIDMEAKISQMAFTLIGYSIHFENQVLYFQSKSILDVFWIMITHNQLQMKAIGCLLLTFSVFFPLLKIASSFFYYYNYHHLKNNPVIKFFVLKSGKWSMADVMVVTIFMSYIGFNGIITSQFGQLSSTNQKLVILTTNGTALQAGYYIFLTYTILALFLSEFLLRTSASPVSSSVEGT